MTDSPQKQPAGAPFVERREHPRRRVDSLIYVGFGDENGGIVLNLSEGGMGFHAAIALQQFHFPKVRFQLPVSGNWTEAAGDVAWMNEARTSAGLKFVNLPEEARTEIRDWVRGQATAVRPVVEQQADEIGQAPRLPRISTPPAAAAPAIQAEEEKPARALVQEDEAAAEFFAPSETGQNEIAVTAAAKGESHEESLQHRASEAEMVIEAVHEEREMPVAAARLEESREMANGSEPGEIGAVEQPAEVAVSQDSSAGLPQEEIRDAAADAEEDEIVAAAIAHAPVAAEKQAYRTSAGTPTDASEGPGSHATFGAAGGTFGWERSQVESGKRFSIGAVAAMLFATIVISFAAGWVVGHGLLDSWIHTSANTNVARTGSAPSAASSAPVAPPTAAHSSTQATVQSPVQGMSAGGQSAGPGANTPSATLTPAANNTAPAMDIATSAGEEVSSTVELPEEPISASSTIAMSATRSVDIPAGVARRGSAHVQPGDLVSHVQPDYPVETMQEMVEGAVKLRVTVAKDGSIKQIEPMGGPPALVGSSVSAVQQWRYRPTYVNGKAVEVQEIVKIVFRLPPSSGNSTANP